MWLVKIRIEDSNKKVIFVVDAIAVDDSPQHALHRVLKEFDPAMVRSRTNLMVITIQHIDPDNLPNVIVCNFKAY